MSDLHDIKVDLDFINKLYMLAKKTPPENADISLDDLKQLVDSIESTIYMLQSPQSGRAEKFYSSKREISRGAHDDESVLIIDDLCIITYQLGVLYKNLGYHVTVAKDIYDAVDKYKKFKFNLVIMDLFLPTEKEGFILLEEIVKLRDMKDLNTRIGVITASSKLEHKELCTQKGADFYVEKSENWQKNLVDESVAK